MYPDYLAGLLKEVERTRPRRLDLALSGQPVYPPMNAEERKDVLSKYHPDFAAGRQARRPRRPQPRRGAHHRGGRHPGSPFDGRAQGDGHPSGGARLRNRPAHHRRRRCRLLGRDHRGAQRRQVADRHQAAHGRRQHHDVRGRHAGRRLAHRLADPPLPRRHRRRPLRERARTGARADRGRPRRGARS